MPPSDPKAQVDAIFRDFDRSDTPGCAVGVYRDRQIAYARGYGMANLELNVGNTPQTVFDIGSIAKQFTAMAIHLLARDGKLSLDDDIRKWVPEIPSYGKTITLRHLLHHTGGIRDYIELMSLQGMVEEDLTATDVLDIMALPTAPNFAPGEDHLYCNTGYILLAVSWRRRTASPCETLPSSGSLRRWAWAHPVSTSPHADHPQPRDRVHQGRMASTGSTCPTGSRRATAL